MAANTSTVQSWPPYSLLNHPVRHSPVHSPLSRTPSHPYMRLTEKDLGITTRCLRFLRYDLLRRRRTLISVPLTSNTENTFSGYVESEVVAAAVSLLNGLRQNPQRPILQYEVKVDPDFIEVRFHAESASSLTFPAFFFPPHSFQRDVEKKGLLVPMSPSFSHAVSSFRPSSQGNSIFATDFSTTVFINSFDEKLGTAVCESAPSSVSLRFLLASYLREALPPDHLDLDTENFVIPQGAPNNPSFSLPPDDEIFTTRHSHSDFDRYTLVNSRSSVEQFFRWKASMRAKAVTVLAGTVLQAECHEFTRVCRPFRPRYPIEPLPESTRAHLRSVARFSYPRFTQLLYHSRTFRLLLDDELTPSEGTAYARTFSCRLMTIDGQLPSDDVPKKLCVKLFDDGAAFVPSHIEYPSLMWWYQNFYTAEDMIQNEINAYMRLEHIWGTVVPHFYGAHRFTLPDGRRLFGILMEYVVKSEAKLEEHSEAAQITFIQSARHAVRVLQYADISQLDWSMDQWICAPSPSYTDSNPALTCVLIDFSLAVQGDCYKDDRKQDDYGEVSDMMCEAGIRPDLIKKWFGPREEWDFFLSSSVMDG